MTRRSSCIGGARRVRALLLAGALLAAGGLSTGARAADAGSVDLGQEIARLQRAGLPAALEQRRQLLNGLQARLTPQDSRNALALRVLECQDPLEPETFLRGVEQTLKAGLEKDADRLLLLECAGRLQEPLRSAAAAIASYTEGIELARALKQEDMLLTLLGVRSGARSQTGQHALALTDALEAYRLAEARGTSDYGFALQNIGIAYRRIGELELAIQYLERSRQQSARLDRWDSLVSDLLQLAYSYHDLGQLDTAMALFRQVQQGAEARGDFANLAAALAGQAMSEVKAKRYTEALASASAARRAFDKVGVTDRMPEFQRARALAGLGQHAEAARLFDALLPAWEAEGQTRYLAMLLESRAATRAALGQHAAAYADLRRYQTLREAQVSQQADQRSQWMRQEFDASQREQQIQALIAARRAQYLAIALALVLLVAVVAIAWRWRLRSRKYRDLALTDTLTGVANRRCVERYAQQCLASRRFGQHAVSLLMFDIDHFKRVNDQHGHAAGDLVIQRVAQTGRAQLRQGDLLGRVGGEEFLVVLPGTDADAARAVAERVRKAVQALDFSDVHPELRVTISLGFVAAGAAEGRDLAHWQACADAALYRAKQGGRNQVQG